MSDIEEISGVLIPIGLHSLTGAVKSSDSACIFSRVEDVVQFPGPLSELLCDFSSNWEIDFGFTAPSVNGFCERSSFAKDQILFFFL